MAAILDACPDARYRTMLTLCYGCGLRLSEVLNTKKRLSAGESFALDSVPGQGTFIRINGERVSTIEGTAFFGCLMSAYLGAKPVDAGLKRTLLGGKPA